MTYGVALVVVLLGALAVAIRLRRRWLERARAHADQLIRPPQVHFKGLDDALRQRTERRREQADEQRREAARIDSGQPPERIHLARRA